MAKSFIGYKLASLYVDGLDVRIDKRDGTSFIVTADSLNVLEDPVTGKTINGEDVSIYESEMRDVVSA
ncbi:MAG: hypothetical protein NTY33_01685 [Candidatus Moranbacteria bacterium]|nr:hypothetical protein [Candidatus Moranbacteria bacterium]